MNESVHDIIPGQVRKIYNVIPQQVCNQVLDYIHWNTGQITFCHLYSCSGYICLDSAVFDLLWQHIKKVIPNIYNGYQIDKLDKDNVKLNICEPGKNYRTNNMVTSDNKDENNILYAYIYLNHNFEGGITRIYDKSNNRNTRDNFYDITPDKGSIVFIDKTVFRQEKPVSDTTKYFITFQVIYKSNPPNIDLGNNQDNNKNKQLIKVSEIGVKDRFSHVPRGNGLKYKTAQILYNDSVMLLVADKQDKFSQYRWNEVRYRSRIFQIEKVNLDSSIDTFQGRPPTDYEDYCPNCYEILPIITDYLNCSGCCSPITNTNQDLRNKIISGK